MIGSTLARTMIINAVMRPLTAFDAEWKQVCLLCTEVPSRENGRVVIENLPDGKQGMAISFTLRENARWADGEKVTPADIVFAWEVGKHPQSGVVAADYYRHISAIDVKDERNFTMHIDRLVWNFNSYAPTPMPAHIERAIFNADPAQYRNHSKFESATTTPGLYFGPYRISAVTPGVSITLEPNTYWNGEKPYFKRIVFKIVENTAALEANLLSGSIDYILGELGLTLDQALAFQKRNPDRFDYIFKTGLIYEHIDLNLDNKLLQDRRVRQALILALDRQTIVQKLFEGKQPVADGPVAPLDPNYSAGVTKYPFDLKKAAALLDEAGFSTMSNGVRTNAAGEKLSFELVTTAGNRVRELVQQVLQAQWKAVGVEIRLKALPPRVFSGNLDHREFSGMAMYAWISGPDTPPRPTLHSQEIPSAANNWAGQNYPGFADPAMDKVLDALDLELDADKRKALAAEMQRIYVESLPVLPLYFRSDPFILPKWLKGVTPTGQSDGTTLWIEEWRDSRN
jgi:peptide/nickel transport system substrate-binding protein